MIFVDDCIGDDVEKAVAAMKEKDVILLENLRFHIGDEKNDPEFAKALARLCDVYIDDAFAVSHRKAASNVAITEFVKVSAAGFVLKDEIDYFNKAMSKPERPLAAIIGGAKVSDKIGVLETLVDTVNKLFIGWHGFISESPRKPRWENQFANMRWSIRQKRLWISEN